MQRLCILFAPVLGSIAFAQSPALFPYPQVGGAGHGNPFTPYGIGDFDGDGQLDLAFGAIGDNTVTPGVTLRRGRGLGFFHPQEETPLGDLPRELAVADVDADGKDDVLAVSWVTGTVNVLHGFSAPSFTSVATMSYPPAPPGSEGVVIAG